QRGLDGGGQAAQRLQLVLVGAQLGRVGQLAVHQQVGDLLELGGLGKLEDVVAAVMQVVAAAAHRAQRRVAGGHAGQGDGFLGLEGRGGLGVGHRSCLFLSGSVRRAARSGGTRASVCNDICNLRSQVLLCCSNDCEHDV